VAGPVFGHRKRRSWLVRCSRRSSTVSRGAGSGAASKTARTSKHRRRVGLTLVSALPGFGKTTPLAESLRAASFDGLSTARLSIDETDNDPALFWRYVVAALRSVAGKKIGAGALALLESSQTPADAVLTTLINDLFTVSGNLCLVLDDYHAIDAREINDGVVVLLGHLPPQVHLIIASRVDPPFSIARLRGDGRLTEIRAADLRFTLEESATYFDVSIGGVLTPQDVAALDERTEGWIAALQLLVRKRGSAAATIAALIGALGAFCGAIVNVFVGINLAAAATAQVTRDAAARFLVTSFNSLPGEVSTDVYAFSEFFAPIIMGVALWRSRSVPRWLAVLFTIGFELAGQTASVGITRVLLQMALFALATVLLAIRIWRVAEPVASGDDHAPTFVAA